MRRWRLNLSNKILLYFFTVLLVVVFQLMQRAPRAEVASLSEQYDRLEQSYEEGQVQLLAKRREVAALKSDPVYIESIAHDVLQVSRPESTVYEFPPSDQ